MGLWHDCIRRQGRVWDLMTWKILQFLCPVSLWILTGWINKVWHFKINKKSAVQHIPQSFPVVLAPMALETPTLLWGLLLPYSGHSSQSGRIPAIKGTSYANVPVECIISKIFFFVLINSSFRTYWNLLSASVEMDISNDIFRSYAVWRDKVTFPRKNWSFASGRKRCGCSTMDNLKYPELQVCSSALNEVSCKYSSFF